MERNFFAVSIIIFAIVLYVPISVFSFGEVAGPVVLHVSIGGSDTQNWGILNNESINVTISADGDGAQYISFPQNVTLLPNNQITWVPITANIPSSYAGTNNITGSLYALEQGTPGQVQINLQLKKNFYILVEQNQASGPSNQPQGIMSNSISSVLQASVTSSISTSSSTSSNSFPTLSASIPQQIQNIAPAVQQATNRITGFLALTQFSMIGLIFALIILVGLFYFLRNRRGGE